MRATPFIALPVLPLLLAGVTSSAHAQQSPPGWPPPLQPQPSATTPPPAAPPPAAAPTTPPPASPPPAGSNGWGFAFGTNAPPAAYSPPPPAAAPAADAMARRDAEMHEMVTLSGSTGLLRVANATSAPVGTFRVQVLWDYFSTSGFLCKSGTPCAPNSTLEDKATHFGATFAASATVTRFLEGYMSIRSYANDNDRNKPALLQVLGDTTIGAKLFLPTQPGKFFNLGADLQLLLLNGSGGVGLDGSSTSFRGRLASTLDFRGVGGGIPLLMHINGGYRFDNSGKIVESVEQQRGNGRINRVERYGLGINRVDLIELGVALEGVFHPGEKVRALRPFVEYTFDIPNNRQDYACAQGRISAGDECLAKAGGFSTSPSRVTLGLRVNPYLKGLMLTGAFDIGVSGHRKFIEEVAPQAPWTLWWGVGYAFDVVERPPVVQTQVVDRIVAAPVMPSYSIAGFVHEAGSQQGVANAIVRFEGRDATGLVTDGSGRFKTSSIDPGTYTFRVKADGYKDGTCSVTVSPSAPGAPGAPGAPAAPGADPGMPSNTQVSTTADVDCALEALPRLGVVAGQVVDAAGGAGVSAVTVTLTDSTGRDRTASTDGSGAFRFADLTPGTYKLRTTSETYLGGLGQAEVKPREDSKVTLSINKRPKNSQVQVGKREIVIKQQVHFETGSAKILSDSDVLLQELADVIVRTPKIKRIEIQGHTDNQGTPAFNKTLSEQRAQAVRDRLVSLGVGADRLEARGYGAERPIVPNVTAGNRARNRRVALIILDQDK